MDGQVVVPLGDFQVRSEFGLAFLFLPWESEVSHDSDDEIMPEESRLPKGVG